MKKFVNKLDNKIIYEIFPRNYSKSGTFNEIYYDLERIKKLGTDIIWFMPFYPIGEKNRKGTYGSPYSIKKYDIISNEFGNIDQFKKIIRKANDLDLKVMIDIVFNHTSNDSFLSKNHKEWFRLNKKGDFERKEQDWFDIIDLDFEKKDLWDYLIGILKYWRDIGVSGFRCDVASMIPIDFWEKARNEVDPQGEMIWLAESLEPKYIIALRRKGYNILSDSELYKVFDLTYDYDGYQHIDEYFKGEKEIECLIDYIKIQQAIYPCNAMKMRFLENHDKPRIASIIFSKEKLKNWTTFYMLLPGVPLIYAGQEIKTEVYPDLFEKSSINWDNGDYEFLNFIKRIIMISKEIKTEANTFKINQIKNGIIEIIWESNSIKYYIYINLEEKYGDINLSKSYSGFDMIKGENIKIQENLKIGKEPIIIKSIK
ncbi:MAG: alpha-amylase family glycosyl hydrolase [Thermotogota bacterium]